MDSINQEDKFYSPLPGDDTPKAAKKGMSGRPTNLSQLIREGNLQQNLHSYFPRTSAATTNSNNKRSVDDMVDEVEIASTKKLRENGSETNGTEVPAALCEAFQLQLNAAVSTITEQLSSFKKEIKLLQNESTSDITSKLSLFQDTLDNVVRSEAKRDEEWNKFKGEINKKLSDFDTKVKAISTNQKSEINKRVDEALATRGAATSQTQPSHLLDKIQMCHEWLEKEEKQRRKNNIVIKGLALPSTNLLTDLNNFFAHHLKITDAIVEARNHKKQGMNDIIIAKVASWETKIQILRSQKSIKIPNQRIYIDNDQTPEECAVDFALRDQARIARREGKRASISRKTLIIDGQRFRWNANEKKLIPADSPAVGATGEQPPKNDNAPKQ